MLVPVRCRCRIPELLDKVGKNQQWLADKTGIQKSRISEIANFKVKTPSLDKLKAIADCLKVYIDDLYEWCWEEQQWPE